MYLDKFFNTNNFAELEFGLDGNDVLINELFNYDRIVDLINNNKDILNNICDNESRYDLLNDDTRFIMIMVCISTIKDLTIRIEAMLQSLIIEGKTIANRKLNDIKLTKDYVRENENNQEFSHLVALDERTKLISSKNRHKLVHSGVIPILKGDNEIHINKAKENLGYKFTQYTNPNQKRIEQVREFLNDVDNDVKELNEIQHGIAKIIINTFINVHPYINENVLTDINDKKD